MKKLIQNLKSFFELNQEGRPETTSPIGFCPTCWGHTEWEGKYYEVISNRHQNKKQYESFLSKVVEEHVNSIHLQENKYICKNCNKEIFEN